MSDTHHLLVRCEFAPLTRSTRFTNGAVYKAYQCFKGARVYDVIDDSGIVRTIIPDEPCPHLTPMEGQYGSRDLGKFVTEVSEWAG